MSAESKSSDSSGRVHRLAFLMERQVGIGSAAAALEPFVRPLAGVSWTDVTYSSTGGWVERMPLPARVRGTVRGYLQTGGALRGTSFDALLFLTHNPAVLRQREMARTATVLWTDVTPVLLDEQAAQYDHSVDKLGALRSFKRAMVKRTFLLAERCVGWSEWARSSFTRDYGVPREKTAVVPPGVNLTHWQLGPRAASGGLPRLLFVGGNFQRKGGDLLLQVFRSQLHGRATLDLVTRDAILEEPGVSVHRGLSAGSAELLELYRRADCFVLPTRGDCFSIASLEAMAVGLPVVTTAVGGIPEIVDEGSSGHLIPPNDGRALGQALESVLGDTARRASMGRRGRALVEERFSADKTAQRLREVMIESSAARRSS